MGRADLQLHSDLGDGLASPEAILDAAERVGLDVIALTDHDDIRGAFLLRDIAARRSSPVEIVPGVEVTTRSGHLLALWIEDEIQMFATLAETISRIHRAGGVAIVPHPLSYLTFSVGEGALRALTAATDPLVHIDGIETRNPSYAGRVRAARSVWLNEKVLHVAATGSSDAHHSNLVGTAWTEFDGNDGDALRRAIADRTTRPDGRHWTLGEHLDGVALQQWRSMVRDPVKRARRRIRRK
ncbi:MAG TPA: PHP-associated domain-containing protein [Candidatus Limnocylindria bacterium]